MSYQADIYAAIQGSAAITTLIRDRFSWDLADGFVPTPYVVAQTISANADTDLSGDRGPTFPLIQLTAWGLGKEAMLEVVRTIASEIEGRNLPGSSGSSLSFAGEQSTYDRNTQLHGEIIEFRVSQQPH